MSQRQGSNSGMKVQITTCSSSDRNNLSAIDLDPEEEKDQTKVLEERFQPLLDWLKSQIGNVVRDGKNKHNVTSRVPISVVFLAQSSSRTDLSLVHAQLLQTLWDTPPTWKGC
jgi:hypothetical protein